jgi:small GTP-binding protein
MEYILMEQDYEVIADKNLSNQNYRFKLIIIGDTEVGKSCSLSRVMDNNFNEEYKTTIGAEFGSFSIKIDNNMVKLQILDTSGDTSFKLFTRTFCKGAHCVFLTYSVTREDSFLQVIDWVKEAKQNPNPDILLYLIGNQADLEEDRQVTKERAIEFQKNNNINAFFETSAKTGNNVEEVFALAAKQLYEIHKNKQTF